MSALSAELEQEYELESELEGEHELEGESELEFEHEHEHEFENEQEFEHEHEFEGEHEQEQEAFFNHLAAMGDRGGRSQALRRVALTAAREALRGSLQRAPSVEGEFEGEFEHEGEFELELEFDPGRRRNLDAMLEHLAHAASESESEQEAAEHFLPLIPLAAKFALPLLGKALPFAAKGLAKMAPKLLKKVMPHLTRGVGKLARSLFRKKATRPLLRALPRIARATVTRLGRQLARGRRITPLSAARTLAAQTARTLGSPRELGHAYRRSVQQDRCFHRRSRRLLGMPQAPHQRAPHFRVPRTSHPHAIAICPCCGRG